MYPEVYFALQSYIFGTDKFYFAPDFADAAVGRRKIMLEKNGASVHLLAFDRDGLKVPGVEYGNDLCIGNLSGISKISRIAVTIKSILLCARKIRNSLKEKSDILWVRNFDLLILIMVLRIIVRKLYQQGMIRKN